MDQNLLPGLAALAHPQRLAVVRLLMQAYPRALAAGRLAQVLDLPASTLSGHLTQLRAAGLIDHVRVGTSLLYSASLAGVTALNTAWIGGVCGGRGWPESGAPGPRVRTILLLGRGNGGPTLVAEALLRSMAGARYEVLSAACADPVPASAALLDGLAAQGLDSDGLWAKPLAAVTGPQAPRPDVVIAIGKTAAAAAPRLDGCPLRAHWDIAAARDPETLIAALRARLRPFAALDPVRTRPAAMLAALDAAALA